MVPPESQGPAAHEAALNESAIRHVFIQGLSQSVRTRTKLMKINRNAATSMWLLYFLRVPANVTLILVV